MLGVIDLIQSTLYMQTSGRDGAFAQNRPFTRVAQLVRAPVLLTGGPRFESVHEYLSGRDVKPTIWLDARVGLRGRT